MSTINMIMAVLRRVQATTDPPPDPDPEDYYGVALVDDQILVDDGYYNAFAMPHQVIDGRCYTLYKKSGSHAAMGPLKFKRSTLVSGTWEEFQVSVGGTPITSAAHSWIQTQSGRFLVAYQDDEVYTSLKIAYTDGDPEDGFTLLHTISLGVGYVSSPSPIKMVVMPSGAIRFYVYKFGSGGNPAIAQDIYLTDNGNSWVWGGVVFNNAVAHPSGFPDWKAHEIGVDIIEDTGTDGTCKMIALARVSLADEGGTYYLHYKSSDGGETWTQDSVSEDAGTFTNDNDALVGGPFNRALLYSFLGSNSPVCVQRFGALVVVVNGERNGTDGYKPKFITSDVTGAMRNKFDDWERPEEIDGNYNAFTLGSSIDCGYCVTFLWKMSADDESPTLWMHDYDISTEPVDTGMSEDRCWIRQKQIVISEP